MSRIGYFEQTGSPCDAVLIENSTGYITDGFVLYLAAENLDDRWRPIWSARCRDAKLQSEARCREKSLGVPNHRRLLRCQARTFFAVLFY